MQGNIKQIIIDEILSRKDKLISFKDFMELALYHPECGYYASGKSKIGKEGDFFTSVSLGSDFGELLAEQIWEFWQVMDRPEIFTIVEMGADSGTLANDILHYLQKHKPEFFQVLEYVIIERSPHLIDRQKNTLASWLQQKTKIFWKSWQEIPDNSLIGCFFSNELVDAFPVHRVVIQQGELREIYVTLSENTDNFREISGKISKAEIREYFDIINIRLDSQAYPENYCTEVNLDSLNWLKNLSIKLKKGYIITIDYGYTAQKYFHPQRIQGTFQCYYQHRYHQNPYIYVGFQDITSHVDFSALQRYGELQGLETLGFVEQAIFLMGLGLGDRLDCLRTEITNLENLFKRRDALHQLISPTGLGSFWVLLQTKALEHHQEKKNLRGFPEKANNLKLLL